MILFNKRKAETFATDTKHKLFKFMDECQKITFYYSDIDNEKDFYASLIDDVVEIFKKDYKRILFVVDNFTDIQWKLTEYDDLNEQEYLFNAENLEKAFTVINMMTNKYDDMLS